MVSKVDVSAFFEHQIDVECTWKDCKNVASKEMVAADGDIWANLCLGHEKKFEGRQDVRATVENWILAQGGTDGMVKRVSRS